MSSNQLPEVVVGFAGPPHPRRISKLSRKYCPDKHRLRQESMPVIPVNPNHPAASAARKRTPSAAVRESPPRAAKSRANNALMHGASAPAPQIATDADNSVGLANVNAVPVVLFAAAAGSVGASARSIYRSLPAASCIHHTAGLKSIKV